LSRRLVFNAVVGSDSEFIEIYEEFVKIFRKALSANMSETLTRLEFSVG
jgi:hypothetical protein